jgi:LmbE family N-acetylglucosaminyl deacetylase|uniref:PIG-L family deacetylase n=1 Tax=Desulfobacca acetoxidans TaxID=60893 RepID=A0A7V6A3I7_9BACT
MPLLLRYKAEVGNNRRKGLFMAEGRGLWRLLWIVPWFLLLLAPVAARARRPLPLAPLITHDTRLLVFSPHPDDESLGAAGLIQRVLEKGGRVQIVFMTNGDGYPDGVEKEDHISSPTAKEYRRYGAQRRTEAVKATRRLGVKARDVIFLGFPDGGLDCLRDRFRTGPQAFMSPFTRANCPPAPEAIIPRTAYTGQDLIREVERVISRFHPNLVATTPPQDAHPDHNATWYFVEEALANLTRKHQDSSPRLLGFLIHFDHWPPARGAMTASCLKPPAGFPDKKARWASLALTPRETLTKRRALRQYRTQMLVMGPYLLSFDRPNELFLLEN